MLYFVAIALVVTVGVPAVSVSQPTASDSSSTAGVCRLSLSLNEFRALALTQSPFLSEIEREYALQTARAFEAQVLSNPELAVEQTYTRMWIDGANDSQSNVSLGQPIKLSQLGARETFARLLGSVADIEKKKRLLEFQQILVAQFYELYFVQESQQLFMQAASRAADGIAQAKRGLAQGLLSDGEEALFEGELFRLQARQMGLQARLDALLRDISTALGSACVIRAREPELMSDLPSKEEVLARAGRSELSETARLELVQKLSEQQAHVAALDAFPTVTPRVLYQHTNDGGDFIGGGITLPLPIWNRNQGERIKADAELRAARQRREFTAKGGFESQVVRAYSAAQHARAQAALYRVKVVPAFQRAVSAQERLYQQGKSSIVQIWQALRAYGEAREQSLSFEVEAINARVQLSLLIGEEV
jgi:cobalt-zinc-cadmium efflux system outer membrane protein